MEKKGLKKKSKKAKKSKSNENHIINRVLLTFVLIAVIWMFALWLKTSFVVRFALPSSGSTETIVTSETTNSSLRISERTGDEQSLMQSNENVFTLPSSFNYDVHDAITMEIRSKLQSHPLKQYPNLYTKYSKIENMLVYLHNTPSCLGRPIILSMARVGSLLYWQLIENFIFTMTKFNLIDCTVMICVRDSNCMRLCERADFPCFNFEYRLARKDVSVMEQIAYLKLFYLPKALEKGVDVFILDLDVGFAASPEQLLRNFTTSKYDVLVQKDLAFVMNTSPELWQTWFTEPTPNIGIMACKGNQKVVNMFAASFEDYNKELEIARRDNPGKDQNKVGYALKKAHWREGLEWGYFPGKSTMLLDKVYKFGDTRIELGGEASNRILLNRTVAAHTTCYEHDSKVLGLKAVNAFWNPYYYDRRRRTLTKKLVFKDIHTLRTELRSLVYLALMTNRSIIVPNLLGPDKILPSLRQYNKKILWPGFRVAKVLPNEMFQINILEPAFYYRVQRDYLSDGDELAEPSIIRFNITSDLKKNLRLGQVLKELQSPEFDSKPRVVLDFIFNPLETSSKSMAMESLPSILEWALDSVGVYGSYEAELSLYFPLPMMNVPLNIFQRGIVKNVRTCASIFQEPKGNRSCFDKCR